MMGSRNKKLKNNVDGDENSQFLLADDEWCWYDS